MTDNISAWSVILCYQWWQFTLSGTCWPNGVGKASGLAPIIFFLKFLLIGQCMYYSHIPNHNHMSTTSNDSNWHEKRLPGNLPYDENDIIFNAAIPATAGLLVEFDVMKTSYLILFLGIQYTLYSCKFCILYIF
jgi:hypothetical protein